MGKACMENLGDIGTFCIFLQKFEEFRIKIDRINFNIGLITACRLFFLHFLQNEFFIFLVAVQRDFYKRICFAGKSVFFKFDSRLPFITCLGANFKESGNCVKKASASAAQGAVDIFFKHKFALVELALIFRLVIKGKNIVFSQVAFFLGFFVIGESNAPWLKICFICAD